MGSIIIIRILFIVCMVFIIGYVFGGFSKNATLNHFHKNCRNTGYYIFYFGQHIPYPV